MLGLLRALYATLEPPTDSQHNHLALLATKGPFRVRGRRNAPRVIQAISPRRRERLHAPHALKALLVPAQGSPPALGVTQSVVSRNTL